MNDNISRREFLETMGGAAASVALSPRARGATVAKAIAPPQPKAPVKASPFAKVVLWPFDYQGVVLRESRWQKQASSGRDFYMSLSDDDVLNGFRVTAGVSAPGKPLGGWAARD